MTTPTGRIATAALAIATWLVASAASAQEAELPLGLADAIRLAFENNLDIKVVGYDRSLASERVTAADGRFDPFLFFGVPGATAVNPYPTGGAFGSPTGFGGFGIADQTFPVSSALAGADVSTQSSFASLVDLQQQLPFGLRYDVSYSVARTDTNSFFNNLNPSWNSTLAVTVVQPLLNGRGREAAASDLLLAQAEVRVSAAAFQAQVQQVMLEVERAYWELVFAIRDLEVKESSLALVQEQRDRTEAQVEVGLIAPVQMTQAEVQVASRETDLIIARNGVDSARDVLLALLRADALPAGWDTIVEPIEEPGTASAPVDLEVAVAAALEKRPELQGARAGVDARQVEVSATRNATLPRLDLLAQLSTNGIGGDLIIRDGFGGEVVEVVPGGYGDALDQMFGLDFTSLRLGVNVTIPLGNQTAESNFAQATLGQDRARADLQRMEQQVILEVRLAARRLEAAIDAVDSTRKTRELAEEQLRIEVDRFDVGMSTNFEVLQFQDQLAIARSQELRAQIELRLAEADLERATGTLLEVHGVALR